ncbi:AraC family transcriptional regulator [Murimonas intestini]|uniref:AraC family transcriptional regulator n=1 Tax=Murimonas intestini TaxID=1337051 RepID=UPI0011DD33E8|nr:AraC family transcriptional regulator [Murimonas intestini]
MHSWEAIEKTLNFIEENLTGEIQTETLADLACLSPFYYQRLFKRLVKKPVQEYIKLRRLAKAADILDNPECRIIDAAMECGFSSHAGFTRAFKEVYHITPEDYRKSSVMLNTFNKPEISMGYVLIDEGFPLITGNIILEIYRRTLTEPEIYLGYEGAVNISEQIPAGESTGIDVPGQLWQQFHDKKDDLAGLFQDNTELGMCYGADPGSGTFKYFAGGLAILSDISTYTADGLTVQSLEAGEYIVCRVEAESFKELVTNALDQASRYLFSTWLPKHALTTRPFSAEKYFTADKDINSLEIWVSPIDTIEKSS